MATKMVIPKSDSESSIVSSNGDCKAVSTAPSAWGQDLECSTIAPAAQSAIKPQNKKPTPPPSSKSNKTATMVGPSSPPPKSKTTTTFVPIAPRPPPALYFSNNAAGSGAYQHPVGLAYSYYLFGVENEACYPFGDTFSQAHGPDNYYQFYHPYMRQVDHQPSPKTVDFLSQMEARGSFLRQLLRENPDNETLAEWGATLRLGNGRSQPVDLNLSLRIG